MNHSLATYITFPGNTAEVFTHWHQVFGGELELIKYGDLSLEGMPFDPDPTAVAHATLKTSGGEIAGGDQMPGEAPAPIRDTAYSLLYTVDNPDQGRELIDKLVVGGGRVEMPFEKAPWGGWYGQVFDHSGVMWAFSAE